MDAIYGEPSVSIPLKAKLVIRDIVDLAFDFVVERESASEGR